MSRSLRSWQNSCITKALEHFTVTPHFFCQATPGAGKTRMAAELANRLLEQDRIDLVLCFAPSCQVVEGFRSTFSEVLGRRLDGQIGAVGAAYTYQAMEYRDDGFWQLLDDYRVLVVFDEIHHCAGHDPLLSNAWGQQILHRIQDRAAFTLALSGTPWRSDDKAIALARYSSPEGHLICDYRYGLKDAITDGVCRSPRIVLLDNQKVKLTEELGADSSVRLFPSIAKLLTTLPADRVDTFEQSAPAGPDFAHRLPLELQSVGFVNDPIQDGIGNRRVEQFVPFFLRVLAGDQRRTVARLLVDSFQRAAQAKIKSRERKRKGGQEPEDDESF